MRGTEERTLRYQLNSKRHLAVEALLDTIRLEARTPQFPMLYLFSPCLMNAPPVKATEQHVSERSSTLVGGLSTLDFGSTS